jgi:hypothetical protein
VHCYRLLSICMTPAQKRSICNIFSRDVLQLLVAAPPTACGCAERCVECCINCMVYMHTYGPYAVWKIALL